MNQTQTRSPRKRWLSLLLAVVLVVGLLPISAFASNDAYSLSASSRFFIVSESDPTDTDLGNFVQLIDQEFAAKNKPSSAPLAIVYGQEKDAENGDIVVKVDGSLAAQSYEISVGQKVTIAGGDAAGVFYGLTNLLQMVEKGSLQDVSNSPLVEERSAYIDCGRVYFSPDMIKALIKTLAWNRMNTLYLDFSNNNATRFFLDEMKVTAGGKDYDITTAKPSDGNYLTQADMVDIIKVAKQYGVQIIPTFNSPGHIGGLYSLDKSLFVKGTASDYDSNCGKITLNIANQNAYDFGQAVVKLYVDFFAQQGCKSFNIAADEATLSGVKYDSTNETFVKYVNDLNTYIKSKGMTTRMFSDGVKSVNSGISKDVVILYWQAQTPNAQAYADADYKVVNLSHYAGLYFAYLGGRSAWWLWNHDVSQVYGAWNPNVTARDSSNSTTYKVAETITSDNLLGAAFAVWTDYAFVDGVSGDQIIQKDSENVVEKIQVVGDRCWSDKSSKTYANWKADLTTAPGGIDVRNNYAIDSTVLPAASAITSAIEASIVVDTANAQGVKVSATKGNYQVILPENGGGTVQLKLVNLTAEHITWTTDNSGVATVNDTGLVTFTGEPGTVTITAQPLSSTNADEATGTYTVAFEVKAAGELAVKEITVQEGRTYDVTLSGNLIDDVKSLSNDYVQVDAAYNRTAEKELQAVTEIESGEQYLIVNQRTKTTLTNSSGTSERYNGLQLSGTASINSTDIWKITKNDSYYKAQYANSNNYLTIDDKTSYVGSSSLARTSLTLSYSEKDGIDGVTGGYWNISSSGYYLNNLGNGTSAGGWNGNGASADDGSKWTLYRIVEKTAANTTTVTFKGLQVGGPVDVTIGDTTYRITVTEKKLVEIPITIIDYRADGLLFDYDYDEGSYAYGLVHDHNGTGKTTNTSTAYGTRLDGAMYGAKIANTMLERTRTGGISGWQDSSLDNSWSRMGLVEPKLGSNGMPVYTKDTIKYVAGMLEQGIYGDVSTDNNKVGFSCNTVLQDTFLKTSSPRKVLDTSTSGFSDAFKDTHSYANITNAYDLAWYLLNNLYVADTNMTTVTGTDRAEHQVPIYGMAVDEYKSIVLTEGADGKYTFEAGYSDNPRDVLYDKENREISNNGGTSTTGFYPLEGLGYEQSGLLKNTSYNDIAKATTPKTSARNGSFTLRGESQFVYNSKANLYFTFTGDDDVYMYINGVLALDLGGAHGRNYKTVNLNDLNKTEYGLVDGQVATFTFFYMERCSDASTFGIETNMELVQRDIAVEKKAYDTNYANEIPSNMSVSTGTTVAYDLILTNKSNTVMDQIVFSDEDDCKAAVSFGYGVNDPQITPGSVPKANGTVTLGQLNSYVIYITEGENESEVANTRQTPASLGDLSKAVAETKLQPGQSLHVRFLTATFTVDSSKILSYLNTVTAKANVGGTSLSDKASHELYSYNANDIGRTYVVDFGLPLRITNIFSVDSSNIGNVELSAANTLKYGTVTKTGAGADIELVYTRTADKTIDNAETIVLDVVYKMGNSNVSLQKTLTIIPASNVYYEDNLASFTDGKGVAEDAKWTKVDNDDKAADKDGGTDVYQALQELGNSGVYGYDTAYNEENSSMLSMGTAHKVTVKSAMADPKTWNDEKDAWPTASFTFTGTGFDIISLTDNTSGAILVSVTGKDYNKNFLVDNYYGYDYNEETGEWTIVNNVGNNALYQIPVMKVDNLDYGTYSVTIQVFYNEFFDVTANDTDGYNFWLDAIRIYNPMGKDYDYTADNEGYPQYILIHDELVKTDETGGFVFIDGAEEATIGQYANYGPNNEVYLAYGQAITFMVPENGQIASIQIGAKAPDGKSASMVVNGDKENAVQLKTATEMYYTISSGDGQFTIANKGEGILSLTNLKITYKTGEQTVTLDGLTAEAQANAVAMVQALFAAPVETFQAERFDVSWGGSVRAGRKATLTVKASEDVDAITVDGVTVSNYTTRTERTGWGWWSPKVTYRVFTYTITATATADYQVCAVNSTGISSEPVIATLTVRPATWWNWWF